jgi:hypothetical protein
MGQGKLEPSVLLAEAEDLLSMKLRETMPDLARHLEGYHVNMFSSDGDA